MTNREVITLTRKEIQEEDADSSYYNSFIYNKLLNNAEWIIKREDSANRIYTSNDLFKTLGCIEVIEVDFNDLCCPIKLNCKKYRTKKKLPELWIGSKGPIIKSVFGIDNMTQYQITTALDFESNNNKRRRPLGYRHHSFHRRHRKRRCTPCSPTPPRSAGACKPRHR